MRIVFVVGGLIACLLSIFWLASASSKRDHVKSFGSAVGQQSFKMRDWSEAGPPKVWQAVVGGGYSSPVLTPTSPPLLIVHDRIDNQENVQCLSVEDGSCIWKHSYTTAYEGETSYSDGPYSTPAVNENAVYSVGAQGQLVCLDLRDGEPRWSVDLQAEFGMRTRLYPFGSSPLLAGEKLFLNVGGTMQDTGVICFDATDGSVIWSSTNALAGYATPQLARFNGRDVLLVLAYESALALDPDSGQLLWEMPLPVRISEAENAVTPLVYHDTVLFSSYGNGSVCVQFSKEQSTVPESNGTNTLGVKELWNSRKILTSQFNSMVCIDGFVYGFHCADHSLRCVDMRSGDIRWREKVKFKRSNLLTVGDRILMLDEFGKLAAMSINPKRFELLSLSQNLLSGQQCFSSPAIHNGHVFVRDESQLACFDLAEER